MHTSLIRSTCFQNLLPMLSLSHAKMKMFIPDIEKVIVIKRNMRKGRIRERAEEFLINQLSAYILNFYWHYHSPNLAADVCFPSQSWIRRHTINTSLNSAHLKLMLRKYITLVDFTPRLSNILKMISTILL